MTFLLSEDKALRNLLTGMIVTDQKSTGAGSTPRKVEVWFGQPDQEIRSQSYPYITIDMIDIAEDFARAHRGKVKPLYYDDPDTVWSYDSVQQTFDLIEWNPENNDWYMDFPIPVNIDYQITVYSRQPRHDREIMAQLLFTKIPLRFAVLETDDNTVRRLDVLDISKRDITEAGKRLFVNAITVRVSSEIAPVLFNKVYKVLEVQASGSAGNPALGDDYLTPIDPFTITTQSVNPPTP
jgi:hypothetical protein